MEDYSGFITASPERFLSGKRRKSTMAKTKSKSTSKVRTASPSTPTKPKPQPRKTPDGYAIPMADLTHENLAKDIALVEHGEVLRWEWNDANAEIMVLMVDGRKFRAAIPPMPYGMKSVNQKEREREQEQINDNSNSSGIYSHPTRYG
jgi:hypothetical protein